MITADAKVGSAVVDVMSLSYFRVTAVEDSGGNLDMNNVQGAFLSMEIFGSMALLKAGASRLLRRDGAGGLLRAFDGVAET